jgi:FkbM family methyltransferase
MTKQTFLSRFLRTPRILVLWLRTAGLKTTLTYVVHRVRRKLGFPKWAIVSVRPHLVTHRSLVRLGHSSDMDVLRQIFLDEEYACLRDIPSPRFIVDLGANVGYSSAYFLSCFPTASVLAIEPDPSNFEILRRNLEPYGDRAKVRLAAVWSCNTKLQLLRDFGDKREWATQVIPAARDQAGCIDGFDVPTLLDFANARYVDLLKIDIEAAELEIFNNQSLSWLERVRNICIELHGNECRNAFMNAITDYEYDLETSGELTICRNLQPKAGKKFSLQNSS